jgi:hypothetical protein
MRVFAIYRFIGILYVFWAACLMALVLLGLCKLPWNGDYVGGDMLWISVLFFSTGVFGSSNMKFVLLNAIIGINTIFSILSTIKFVMNIVSLGVSVEKTCVSVNLIYQAATYQDYLNEQVLPRQTYIAQIVLHSCQCFVLFGELVNGFIDDVGEVWVLILWAHERFLKTFLKCFGKVRSLNCTFAEL